MKTMKKVLALALAAIMVMALAGTAMAQTKASGQGGTATLTINNAAKGETYKIAKLFDATISTTGSIAYTGEIPAALASYFTKDVAGNISAAEGLDLRAAQPALKTWAEANVTAQEVSDGSALTFTGLKYGYYIITTTQGEALLTIDSTNPNASVNDKNSTPPVSELGKEVAETDEVVSIGDEITYTITFKTANYDGTDQITKYVIEDTLPDFLTLSANAVQSIIIDDDADATTTDDQHNVTAQFTDKKIELTWTNGTTSRYKNGALVTIVYKATVNDKIAAGNVTTNKNEVTITPYAGDKTIETENNKTDETIQTYAAAIKKVDESGNPLAGATFQVPGLTVTGSNGNYTVVSYDPASTTTGTTMECDPDGVLVIRGISNEAAITVYEVEAPNGYNKLTEGKPLSVVKTSEATTTTTKEETKTTYYDADGNIVGSEVAGGTSTNKTVNVLVTNADLIAGALTVENKKGTELPSTGGIGTTIFYIVGAILVLGAGAVLVARRKASAK